MLHPLGGDPAEDTFVHATPEHPTWGFDAALTHDDRWLVDPRLGGDRARPTGCTSPHIGDDGTLGAVHRSCPSPTRATTWSAPSATGCGSTPTTTPR